MERLHYPANMEFQWIHNRKKVEKKVNETLNTISNENGLKTPVTWRAEKNDILSKMLDHLILETIRAWWPVETKTISRKK